MSMRQHSLTATVALVLVAVGWTVFQARAERPKLPRPVAINRPAPMVSPPTAHDILDGGALLDVKAAQRAQLRALDARWVSESAGFQAQLDAATAEFSRFMDEARATGRTRLQEIQRRSAEIGELSAALRHRRQLHTEAAAAVLTDWQRARLGDIPRVVASGGQR